MRLCSRWTGKRRLVRALWILPVAWAVASTATAAVLDVPWSGSGTGTTTVVSDGTSGPTTFTYSDVEGGVFGGNAGNWTFNTVAARARTVVLKYTYTGFHAYFQVRVGLAAFVGATTPPLVNAGPVNCCTPPSGGVHLQRNGHPVRPGWRHLWVQDVRQQL